MAKKQAAAEKQTATASESAPDRYVAYTVTGQRSARDRGFWTKVGVMFPHKNGEGFTLQLDALPLDGKVVLLPPKPDEEEANDNMDQGEGA